MTAVARRKTYNALIRPSMVHQPVQVLPIYDVRGQLQGALIRGEWWWPEDIRLLYPDLKL